MFSKYVRLYNYIYNILHLTVAGGLNHHIVSDSLIKSIVRRQKLKKYMYKGRLKPERVTSEGNVGDVGVDSGGRLNLWIPGKQRHEERLQSVQEQIKCSLTPLIYLYETKNFFLSFIFTTASISVLITLHSCPLSRN